jgi:hypothetical protein
VLTATDSRAESLSWRSGHLASAANAKHRVLHTRCGEHIHLYGEHIQLATVTITVTNANLDPSGVNHWASSPSSHTVRGLQLTIPGITTSQSRFSFSGHAGRTVFRQALVHRALVHSVYPPRTITAETQLRW